MVFLHDSFSLYTKYKSQYMIMTEFVTTVVLYSHDHCNSIGCRKEGRT